MRHIKFVGTGFFAIGAVIFFLGFKVENYNLYFFMIGGFLVVVGFVLTVFINMKEGKVADVGYQAWKDNLIKNGIRIEVDLSKVEIKSNIYREEIINDGLSEIEKYKALDTLVGKDNREYNDVKQSVLIYETEVLGQKRTFYSPIIPKDSITLQFLLAGQKEILIYADTLNQDDYLFDIEFLKE